MNFFKGLGDLGSMFGQMQQMGSQMEAIKEELRNERVEGSSGGGMVTVEMNGAGEVLKITIDPGLVARNEVEMLEDLIPAAVNDAVQKAKEIHAQKLQSLTSGLPIPGIQDALAKLAGTTQPPGDDH